MPGEDEDQQNAPPDKLVVGVSIHAGVAYFGVVKCPDVILIDDRLDRIVPATQGSLSTDLDDFKNRVLQELRRLQPHAVGVGFTRKYGGWTAQNAFKRFSLDAAVMIAAAELGVRCDRVKLEAAAKAVGVPPTKMDELGASSLGISPPRNRTERTWAVATALAVAETVC